MVYHTFLGKFQPAFSISGPGDGFKKRYAFLIINSCHQGHGVRRPERIVPKGQLRMCRGGIAVFSVYLYVVSLHGQPKNGIHGLYSTCTELTAWLYSYSIFFNTGVYNITHYC